MTPANPSHSALVMLSRHFIQSLRHLVLKILKIIHRRHWIRFLLRQLIFLHQRLFSPDPPSRTQARRSQQQSHTHSTLRSVGQGDDHGAVLMSRIPANIISTSSSGNALGPASPSDVPYIVESEDLARSSPRTSVWDVNQDNGIRIDQTHDPVHHSNSLLLQPCAPSIGRHPHFSSDTPNLRERNQHVSENPHATSLAVPDTLTDPIDVAQAHRHTSLSHSLHPLLTGSPRTLGTSLPPSPSATSFRSAATHRTVRSFGSVASSGRASYRRHEGPTPHVRHPYGNHSAANSHTSLSLRVVVHPGGGPVASPRNNDEPGDATECVEYPRFAQMVSGDVKRYQKNYST